MRITLDSTDETGTITVNDARVPARFWVGTTEQGNRVAAFITRIAPLDQGAAIELELSLFDVTAQTTTVIEGPAEPEISQDIDINGDLDQFVKSAEAATERLVHKIAPILRGNHASVQGAALGELTAMWVAGHAPHLRERVITRHQTLTTDLIPEVERAMFNGKGHPYTRAPGDEA